MIKNIEALNVINESTKSEFEKLIIESFKESNIINSYNFLSRAYDELPNFIEEIRHSRKIAFILNSNILIKIDRLSQRNFININILISKIIYTILNANNFKLLSDDSRTLITLCNISMNLLEMISSYELCESLIKRVITFLNFLKNNSDKYLNNEQLNIIKNIQKNLGEKIYSKEYTYFGNNYQKDILFYFYKESSNEKEKGIINLFNNFFKLKSLYEQFDLLCEFGYLILNAIMNKANPSYIEIYYKTADFLIYFVYNFYYVIKIKEQKNNINFNANNFYLNDNMNINNLLEKNDIKLDNFENFNNPDNLNFLNDKKFELDEQKNFLLNYPNIFSISSILISYLMIYESSFNCQYAAYIIIKRLYFIFPHYRDKIEDLLPIILLNLLTFQKDQIKNEDISYQLFIKYLLQNGEESLKEKLKVRLNSQNLEKNLLDELLNDNSIKKSDVENDIIFLDDFDLKIGFPLNLEIFAGYSEEKIIEIKNENSIIFIMFNSVGMDITFRLFKFCPFIKEENKENYFYEIFKIEKTEGCKIILFVKNPGIYKVVFDNKYSWINSKTIRYRISILKELISSNIKDNINNSDNIIDFLNKNKNEK